MIKYAFNPTSKSKSENSVYVFFDKHIGNYILWEMYLHNLFIYMTLYLL